MYVCVCVHTYISYVLRQAKHAKNVGPSLMTVHIDPLSAWIYSAVNNLLECAPHSAIGFKNSRFLSKIAKFVSKSSREISLVIKHTNNLDKYHIAHRTFEILFMRFF